jgi:hypothetical protein
LAVASIEELMADFRDSPDLRWQTSLALTQVAYLEDCQPAFA